MKRQNLRTVSLIVVTFTYLLIGAAIFGYLESEHEVRQRETLDWIESMVRRKYNISDDDFTVLTTTVIKSVPHKAGIQWKFPGAFYFATTVVTTIGYGHSTPATVAGRSFCMIYALIGIPLGLVMFQSIGERLNTFVGSALRYTKGCLRARNPEVTQTNLVMVVLVLSTILMTSMAAVFAKYERWDYFDALYYCFITLTTIGFGDYVALQKESALQSKPEYVALSLIFILFGLSVVSSAVNLLVLKFLTLNTEDERRDEQLRYTANLNPILLKGDVITSSGGLLQYASNPRRQSSPGAQRTLRQSAQERLIGKTAAGGAVGKLGGRASLRDDQVSSSSALVPFMSSSSAWPSGCPQSHRNRKLPGQQRHELVDTETTTELNEDDDDYEYDYDAEGDHCNRQGHNQCLCYPDRLFLAGDSSEEEHRYRQRQLHQQQQSHRHSFNPSLVKPSKPISLSNNHDRKLSSASSFKNRQNHQQRRFHHHCQSNTSPNNKHLLNQINTTTTTTTTTASLENQNSASLASSKLCPRVFPSPTTNQQHHDHQPDGVGGGHTHNQQPRGHHLVDQHSQHQHHLQQHHAHHRHHHNPPLSRQPQHQHHHDHRQNNNNNSNYYYLHRQHPASRDTRAYQVTDQAVVMGLDARELKRLAHQQSCYGAVDDELAVSQDDLNSSCSCSRLSITSEPRPDSCSQCDPHRQHWYNNQRQYHHHHQEQQGSFNELRARTYAIHQNGHLSTKRQPSSKSTSALEAQRDRDSPTLLERPLTASGSQGQLSLSAKKLSNVQQARTTGSNRRPKLICKCCCSHKECIEHALQQQSANRQYGTDRLASPSEEIQQKQHQDKAAAEINDSCEKKDEDQGDEKLNQGEITQVSISSDETNQTSAQVVDQQTTEDHNLKDPNLSA